MVRENVYIHVFLTSTTDDGEWQSTCSGFFVQTATITQWAGTMWTIEKF